MPPAQPLSDTRLRSQVLQAAPSAAQELLCEHAAALFDFVFYRSGRDRARAEDIVQDTFLVAIDRMADFDGRSSLFTWLCGIAKNKLRAEGRRLRPLAVEDLLAASDGQIEAILAEIERTPLPEELLERRETRELVGATLSSLPPAYRQALIEKYVDGSSVSQMATRRSKSIKATESTLHRARLAFTRIFTLLAKKRGDLP